MRSLIGGAIAAVLVVVAPAVTAAEVPEEKDSPPAQAVIDVDAAVTACAADYQVLRFSAAARRDGYRPRNPVRVSGGPGGELRLRFKAPVGRFDVGAVLDVAAGDDDLVGTLDSDGVGADALDGARLQLDASTCTIAVVAPGSDAEFTSPDLLLAPGSTFAEALQAALSDVSDEVGRQSLRVPLVIYPDDPRPAATTSLVTDEDLLRTLRAGGDDAVRSFLRARPGLLWGPSERALLDADGTALSPSGKTPTGDSLYQGRAWDVAVSDPSRRGVRTLQVRVHNSWLIDRILGPAAQLGDDKVVAGRNAAGRVDRAEVVLFGGSASDDDDPRPPRGLSVPIYDGTGVTAAQSTSPLGWRRAGPTLPPEDAGADTAVSMAAQRPQTEFRTPLWRAGSFNLYYNRARESARLWDYWQNSVWYEPPRDERGQTLKLEIAGRAGSGNIFDTDEGVWELGSDEVPDDPEAKGATVDLLRFRPWGPQNPNRRTPALGTRGWPYEAGGGVQSRAFTTVRVEPAGIAAPTSLSLRVPYPSDLPGPVTQSTYASSPAALAQTTTTLPKGSNPCLRPPTGEVATLRDGATNGIKAVLYRDVPLGWLPFPQTNPFPTGKEPSKLTSNADARPHPAREQITDRNVENDDRSVGTKVIRVSGERAIVCADVRQATMPHECTDRLFGGPNNNAFGRDTYWVRERGGMCRYTLSSASVGSAASWEWLCPKGSEAYADICAAPTVTVAKGRLSCPRSYPYNLSYEPKPDQYFRINLSFLQGASSKLVKDGLVRGMSKLSNWYQEPAKSAKKEADDKKKAAELARNQVDMQLKKGPEESGDGTADVLRKLAEQYISPEEVDRMRDEFLNGDVDVSIDRPGRDDPVYESMFGDMFDEPAGRAARAAAAAPKAHASGIVETLAGAAADGLVGLAFKALGISEIKIRTTWTRDAYQVATDASAYDDLTDRWGLVYQMEEEQMLKTQDGKTVTAHGARGTSVDDRGYQDVAVAAWGAAGSAYITCGTTPEGPAQ